MTEAQYRQVCSIFGRKLTEEELRNMNMSPVNGKWDDDLADDLNLYRQDMRKRPMNVNVRRILMEVTLEEYSALNNVIVEERYRVNKKYSALHLAEDRAQVLLFDSLNDKLRDGLSDIETPLARVLLELRELNEKITKLEAFTRSKKFKSMTPDETVLLSRQLSLQKAYAKVLEERLKIWRS